jgi:hypothetical protein
LLAVLDRMVFPLTSAALSLSLFST